MNNIVISYLLALVTLVLALVLAGMDSLWSSWAWLAPEWILVTLIFWLNHRQVAFGVGMAWVLGILTDVWLGTTLGQNALQFVVIAFVLKFVFADFRGIDFLSQGLLIVALVLVYKLLNGFLSFGWEVLISSSTLFYLGTAISSGLFWVVLQVFAVDDRTDYNNELP